MDDEVEKIRKEAVIASCSGSMKCSIKIRTSSFAKEKERSNNPV
jgi:hypothetical protein